MKRQTGLEEMAGGTGRTTTFYNSAVRGREFHNVLGNFESIKFFSQW